MDLDLDEGQIGGVVTFQLPEDLTYVDAYQVKLSYGIYGLNSGVQLIGDAVSVNSKAVNADTLFGDFTHLSVYTRSILVEQSTPETLLFNDTVSPVQGLLFADLDLDVLELGGDLLWLPSEESRLVESYEVYLAKIITQASQCFEEAANMTPYAASGNESLEQSLEQSFIWPFHSNETLFWCRVPLGTAQSSSYNWTVPPETPMQSWTHFLVYSRLCV